MTPEERIAQPYNPLLPRERCSKGWFLEKSYKLLPFRQDLSRQIMPQTTAFIHPALIKRLLDVLHHIRHRRPLQDPTFGK